MLDHGAAVRHGGRAGALAAHLRGRNGQTTLDRDAAATPTSRYYSTLTRLAPGCAQVRPLRLSEGARRLWAARHSQGPRTAHGTQPLPREPLKTLFVRHLQESCRNHERGQTRALSARIKQPVMAEPQHVFRSFPTTQAAW